MLAEVKWAVAYGLVFVVSVPINGLLIAATWGWFVVPITGAQEIGIGEGVGLSFFLAIAGRAATGHLIKLDNDDETEPDRIAAATFAKLVGIGVLGPLMTLATAWAWHTFVISRISN